MQPDEGYRTYGPTRQNEGLRSDFNPIENAFAKLKGLLRQTGGRTVEGIWTTTGKLLDAFKHSEYANDLTAVGYDVTWAVPAPETSAISPHRLRRSLATEHQASHLRL
jgi:hypothetical protein